MSGCGAAGSLVSSDARARDHWPTGEVQGIEAEIPARCRKGADRGGAGAGEAFPGRKARLIPGCQCEECRARWIADLVEYAAFLEETVRRIERLLPPHAGHAATRSG